MGYNIVRSQKVPYTIVGVNKVLPIINPGVNYIFTAKDLSVFTPELQQTSILFVSNFMLLKHKITFILLSVHRMLEHPCIYLSCLHIDHSLPFFG